MNLILCILDFFSIFSIELAFQKKNWMARNCRDDFDIQRFREAAHIFVGKHDFRTFMSINNDAHVS